MAGAIFLVTVPEIIITSDCLGEGQGTMPKRSKSCLAMKLEIISMAQQARPVLPRRQPLDLVPDIGRDRIADRLLGVVPYLADLDERLLRHLATYVQRSTPFFQAYRRPNPRIRINTSIS